MFNRILVLCDGNICRSPTAEALLKAQCPDKQISSAGLVGLEGQGMEPTAQAMLEADGQPAPCHVARKLSREMCAEADLILVMEKRQRDKLTQRYPESSGKVFLLTQWNGQQDIPDPYRRSREVFEQVYQRIAEATTAWASKLH